MLDSLTARGGAVVVTTHYEGLKALALADERFQNASMGFDLATMSPTFKLATGVPGSSSALAVARKFGLPGTVIERAERFLTREDLNFETSVQKLNDERRALELARADAERRELEAEQTRRALAEELRQAKDREQKHVSKETEALLASVRRAREELREAQAKLRSKKLDAQAAKEAQAAIDRVAAQVAVGGALDPGRFSTPTPPPPPVAITAKKGMRVFVTRVRAEADVLEVLPDGAVRVQAGPLKLVVDPSEIRAVQAESEPRRKAAAAAAKPGDDPVGLEAAVQTSDNTCDLRGLRTDDALSLAVSFLDRSINDNRRVCFLLHGHGTGALKDAIRKELKQSPYVRYFRAGHNGEGGDGVTVAWLS
jgi:DNA mismatch repair protein MutS2